MIIVRPATSPGNQGIFEEYMLVCESLHLDPLAPWDGGEVVEESTDYDVVLAMVQTTQWAQVTH